MNNSEKTQVFSQTEITPCGDTGTRYESGRYTIDDPKAETFSPTTPDSQTPSPCSSRFLPSSLPLLRRNRAAGYPVEPTKIAYHKGYLRALQQHAFHIIPFSIAGYLIYLNTKGHFLGEKPGWMEKLLFVAKPVEITMQLSITAILLAYVNDQARSGFISFGCLFAPSNVAAIDYLVSRRFYSSFRKSALPYWSTLATAMLVMYCIVLANLVGPSSGTAMIPREISRIVGGNGNLSLVETPFVVFPNNIDKGYKPQIRGDYLWSLNTMKMPRDHDLFKWDFTVADVAFSRILNLSLGVDDRQFPMAEASMPRSTFNDILRVTDEISKTATENQTGSAISKRKKAEDPRTLFTQATIYQPLVQVQCFKEEYFNAPGNETMIRIPHPSGEGFTKFISIGDLVNIAYSPDQRSNYTHKKYLDHWMTPPLDVGYSVVQFTAYSGGDELGATITDTVTISSSNSTFWSNTTLIITACGIHATWQQARYNMISTLTVPLIRASPPPSNAQGSQTPIRIDQTFASNIWHAAIGNGENDYAYRYYEPFNQTELDVSQTRPSEQQHSEASKEMIIAALFANALANIEPERHSYRKGNDTCNEYPHSTPNYGEKAYCSLAENVPTSICPDSFSLTTDNCTRITATVFEGGWGYEWDGDAIKLSILTLCFYCLTVVVFWVGICVRPITCVAWRTPADLVALALQSRTPRFLGNVGVRVGMRETFGQPVGVRVGAEGGLELVFGNDPLLDGCGLGKVEAGRMY
ncbi:hypothetical protein P280DRAFT_537910 [Massarina eburnea CBS 473.64]|uniref:Uncharacterized protein n=1 Tax=Massarina eburnea CBS 473.64 TaxID=1395130 RepID=A0A6A6SA99_9PLEO|nr:hypothetical protein P280DRAFT_537910 [Massarina eburnea CBS 473.64]